MKKENGSAVILNQFNSSIRETRERKIDEARKDLVLINSSTHQLQSTCNNNLAYLLSAEGDIKSAIELLENTIKANPFGINEVLIQNLVILYDFYYPDTRDKKKLIDELIENYGRDAFNKQASEIEMIHSLKWL
eukprot:CAMPEP_0176447928 /NCGR_PEP_ID=MMETSP0127-20121128/25406_1 /TAXON_ID=938130 /ORGANISM="Platyophrya macrostoma, Strain WH" /LENGTH=133 /DNA_ID=CAMNT_0017834633 /DNA_START=203 /DNA_END=604 /DNA_ORIENTATION=+